MAASWLVGRGVLAGPLLRVVLLHERGAFLIDRSYQLDSFRFILAELAHAPDLLFEWGIQKQVEGVWAAAQHVGRAAPYNHASARGSPTLDHALHKHHHAVRVQMFQPIYRQAPFVLSRMNTFMSL